MKVPPDLPWVLAEPALIEQVLLNLLENALRYTPPAAGIEVTPKPVIPSSNCKLSTGAPASPRANARKSSKISSAGLGRKMMAASVLGHDLSCDRACARRQDRSSRASGGRDHCRVHLTGSFADQSGPVRQAR